MAKSLRGSGLVILTVMAGSAAGTMATPPQVTPAEYLAGLPQPSFQKNQTLPPLTRFAWTLPFGARVELARRWGYTLEFGGYARLQEVEAKLADPNSVESRLCVLAAAQPETFKLAVTLDRDFPQPVPDEFWVRDEQGNFTDGKNTWQDPAHSKFSKIASPEAPNAYWQKVAQAWAAPLALIRQRAPIAVVLNGGEYAMGVAGAQAKQWELDPRVRAARGNRSWFEYASDRKGHQEEIVAKAVREAVPDRELYIYYNTSSESHRRRYDGWEQWAYDSAALRSVSDLPSFESYYRHQRRDCFHVPVQCAKNTLRHRLSVESIDPRTPSLDLSRRMDTAHESILIRIIGRRYVGQAQIKHTQKGSRE